MIKVITTPDGKKHPIYDMEAAWKYFINVSEIDEDHMSTIEQRNMKMSFMSGMTDMFSKLTADLNKIPAEYRLDFIELVRTQLNNFWDDAINTPQTKKI